MFILFWISYAMPALMLNIPAVQRKATVFVESELSKFFDTSVRIGKVDVNWLNRVVIKDIQIKDRKDEVALEGDNITVGFKLLSALQNKWVLTTVRLFGISVHVSKETAQNEMNIQFLLDALSNDSQENSNLHLQIQSVLIRRGAVNYHILDKDSTGQPFNPNHINIDNLNSKLSVKHYSRDSIHAQISKMSFNGLSGLNVNRLSARITGNMEAVNIEDLVLSLPGTSISIPSAAIRLNQTDSLSQSTEQSWLTVRLEPSTVAPKDFAFFTPLLKDFSDIVDVSGDIYGFTNSISLDKLTVAYGKEMTLSGSLDLSNVVDKGGELYLFGQVNNLHVTTEGLRKIMNNFKQFSFTLPKPVMNMEELHFAGEISGFTDHLVAFGNLSSPIGSIQTDLLIGQRHGKDTTLYLKGLIASSDLQINTLFDERYPLGKTRFNMELDIVQLRNKTFAGTLNAQISEFEYNGYNYENIFLSGKYKENEFEGAVKVDDPNGQLEVQGLFRNEKEKSVFDFMANLTHFHPDKLHLVERFENPDLSLGINANFTGNNPDDFNGYIELKDVLFHTEKDSFSINNLRIETFADDQATKQINISSSLLNGGIKGFYSIPALLPNLLKTVENYLPSLAHSVSSGKPAKADNVFDFSLTVENTEDLSKTLKLPVTILQKTDIYGQYNSVTHSLFTTVDAPLLKIGNIPLENGKLRIENTNEVINVLFNATRHANNNIYSYLHFTSEIKDDRILSNLRWSNDTDEKFETELTASTLFIEETDKNGNRKIRAEVTVPPAQITLKDEVWDIEPASVTISNGKVSIDNFYLTKDNQYLKINGVISDNPQDALSLELNDVETGYIFDILNKPQIQFGGRATGSIKARDLFSRMMIEGRLEIIDFSFHQAVQGKLNISSEWDNDRQGILLVGTIYKDETTWTDVNGYIFPIGPERGLSLFFDANEINLAFLQKYMSGFSDSFSGLGFGTVHLQGPFSEIFLEGKPYVKDAAIKINFLNTTYSLSDTVFLERHFIRTYNTTLYDREGHTGNLDFTLKHTGFKDMSFNLDLRTNNMLVYDIPERINPEIYGKVYAGGTAAINGTEEFISVEGNVRSNAGTAVGFNFTDNSSVRNYDFITLTDKSEDIVPDIENRQENNEQNQSGNVDYMLNFLVNVTPDAQFELMMNPDTGDKISGNGNGNFQIQYGSRNDMQIFGNYFISGGSYNFNLEQVIRKRFNIQDGSIISFHGDPMEANLNINAIYNLVANIQDLDELLIKETASPTIPVNCILKLEGHLQNPAITFDLELPNSNNELERQVKSFIDTEDMMTRQIIYLLLLHKFYPPNYSRNDFTINEFSAVASSALSAQLSNILNSLTDKVQIGANIRSRQDGIKDTEIEMLLSSQLLNNRLLFNGNFGYKDNYIQSNAFIGEFDLEYKLSRTGEISLKAYNHANDLYRYTKSLTRQGVGVMFRKDFTVLADLFRRKRKPDYANDKKN